LRSRFIKLTLFRLPFPAIKFLPREESEEDAFGGAGSKSMLKTVDDQGPSARKKPFAGAGGQEPIHWQQFEQEKVEAIPASVKKVSGPTKTIPEHRIVHFDLKGAAPKPDYLKSVMTLAKKSGATGILFEWEDMLPYSGPLANLSRQIHYTEVEVTIGHRQASFAPCVHRVSFLCPVPYKVVFSVSYIPG
jgi:hypothetical protein